MSKPRISFVIPTHNRRSRTCRTLDLLERHVGPVPHEVIVVDNASEDGTTEAIATGFPQVRLIDLSENLNSAARNVGLAAARAELVFVLDDDSWPEPGATEAAVHIMASQPRLGAAGCYVQRPGPEACHERGGLPGVFIGCGAVLRKQAVLEAGGYPIDYGYYVEEYDLCARLWQAGWGVRWMAELLVWHEPAAQGRDKNRILKMLTANNLRFWSRFAPARRRQAMWNETIERYGQIARKENALAGYQEGLRIGLDAAAAGERRARPLTQEQFASLYGLDELRSRLLQARARGITRLLLWRRGKGAEQILETAGELGMTFAGLVAEPADGAADGPFSRIPTCSPSEAEGIGAQGAVIGSLSPGASLDLLAEADSHLSEIPLIDPVLRTAPMAVPSAA